jgi:hypothetical protein
MEKHMSGDRMTDKCTDARRWTANGDSSIETSFVDLMPHLLILG